VFEPDKIIYDFDDVSFPLRTFTMNGVSGTYATRKKITKPVRKIRIEGGADFLQLSQVVVFNTDFVNVAKGRVPTGNTSPAYVEGGVTAAATNATDGVELARGMPFIYDSQGQPGVFELDLGKEHYIHSISVYNRKEVTASGADNLTLAKRWAGYKLRCYDAAGGLNYEFALQGSIQASGGPELPNYSQTFAEFAAVDLQRRAPLNSFLVPLAMPPETTLGGAACPTRCSDLDQVNRLVEQFNGATENVSRKIMKVTKAWTPRENRCDYEVEMMRVDPAGIKTFQKETLYMNVARDGATCTFNRTADGAANINSGSYIQSNTPDLTFPGVSGTTAKGLMSFDKLTTQVRGVFGTMSQAIQQKNPLDTLKARALDADKTTTAALSYVAANQTLKGCPTKCSDPSVLAAIFTKYNAEKGQLKGQFGANRSTMKRILKAGGASPTDCDILFEELAESYDDSLYPATTTQKVVRAVRVKMADAGKCAWGVAPAAAGASSFLDVSGDAVGLLADTSKLADPGFSIASCEVDCRAPANLKAVQAAANAAATSGNITTNFRQVTQSFRNGGTVCEYAMMKDVTTKDANTRASTRETDLETYVTATFGQAAGTTCAHTLSSAVEFYPDDMETRINMTTGDEEYYLGNKRIIAPLLFSYDSTTPSTLVNASAQNI
jgi:hypothetical protein